MKFEYSDFYKFIASAGIALISLAVIVPWLFFREPFDLLLSTNELAYLSTASELDFGRLSTTKECYCERNG